MTSSDLWIVIGAVGQWAGALAGAGAVVVALWQTKRASDLQQAQTLAVEKDRQAEIRRRALHHLHALLMEVRENRRLLLHPIVGFAKLRLRREAWTAARTELNTLSDALNMRLQDSYQYAKHMDDLVDADLAIGPNRGLLDTEFHKIVHLAQGRFQDTDRDLSAYLDASGVPIRPYEQRLDGPIM